MKKRISSNLPYLGGLGFVMFSLLTIFNLHEYWSWAELLQPLALLIVAFAYISVCKVVYKVENTLVIYNFWNLKKEIAIITLNDDVIVKTKLVIMKEVLDAKTGKAYTYFASVPWVDI